ncbi:hypothetical protein [Actinomadura violacea]|uniref:Uncharacterized protein n=1 Tax=Actinomadura violacea TaxID=2819934 RepID=A0ABS3RNU5_9ACTN|nr:hypothetical protein [Actinomadura violacea]MBO2458342.1 hypothetical protein [Actinomadura violacea]
MSISGFVVQPSALQECRAGADLFSRPEIQAFLQRVASPDAAIAELAELVEGGDVFRGGMTAFLCGVMVERGASAPNAANAVLPVMRRYLHLARELVAQAGTEEEVFERSPDLVRAHHALPFVLLATMTILSRDEQARKRMRADSEVVALVAELEERYETLYYVREVLALLDDQKILLLDPRNGRGFLFELTGVRDVMYHFFALAQDALLRHAGPGYLGAEPTDPAAVRYARNAGLTQQEFQDAGDLIDHQRFGFHYPGAGDSPIPALFFPGSAAFSQIPVIDGCSTLFLTSRSIHAQWAPTNMYPVLHEALEARVDLRELAPEEVKARLAAFDRGGG